MSNVEKRRARSAANAAEVAAHGIGINDVYAVPGEAGERLFRILWVDVEGQTVVLLPLGEKALPVSEPLAAVGLRIASGDFNWTSSHPFKRKAPPPVPLTEVRDKAVRLVAPRNAPEARPAETKLIERHRALIGRLADAAKDGSLFDGSYSQQVTRHAQLAGASRATLSRVLLTWLENGMTDAALGSLRKGCRLGPRKWTGVKPGRRRAGEPVGIALTEEVRRAFDWAVKWLTEHPHNQRVDGFIAMTNEFFSEGTMMVGEVEIPRPIEPHLRPTERQFARYIRKKLPDAARKRAQRGERHYELNVAPVFGTTSGWSFGPGSMAHLDSSQMAQQIVDTETRSINLGQPTVYFMIDDFSTVITGRLGVLDVEKAEDAILVVADSMVGVISAPRALPGAQQLPDIRKFKTKEGFTDKGGSYLAKLTDEVHRRMGAGVANPQGGRPNKRGRAEQRFNMANAFAAFMPGAISKRRKGKGHAKRGGDASLTIDEYLEVVDEFIRYHNSTHRPSHAPPESFQADGRPRTAFELMLWGFKHRGAPDRCSADEVRLCLYEQIVATVDQHGRGLQAEGIFYKTLEDIAGLDFTRAGGRVKPGWIIIRDRQRVGSAWLLVDDGAAVVELEVTPSSKARAELSAAEWKALRRMEREGNRNGRAEQLAQRSASTTVLDQIAQKSVQARGPKRAKPSSAAGAAREAESAVVRAKTRASLIANSPSEQVRDADAVPRPPATVVRTRQPSMNTDLDEFRALKARLKAEGADT